MSPYRLLNVSVSLAFLVFPAQARADASKPSEAGPAACPVLAERAEAKSKAKQFAEAAALWERVVELNPVVGDYWAKLARARYDAKDYRKAIPANEKALELGGGYRWAAAYDIGCCYALLGEKEAALKWLEKAFALGFRKLKHARDDDDLDDQPPSKCQSWY